MNYGFIGFGVLPILIKFEKTLNFPFSNWKN